jgi:hypothetical protein
VVWDGRVTPAEWYSHFDALLANPEFPPGPSWLVDARRANVDAFDETELVRMGARVNEHAERMSGIRMAVVPNDAWDKASKLLDNEVKVERLTTIQFAGFDTACLWLGVPIEATHAIVGDLRGRPASVSDV